MKVKGFVAKIYPVNEGESLSGKWRNLDVVLRNEESITNTDGSNGKIMELIVIRIRGEKIENFLSEVKHEMLIEAVIRPWCNEKTNRETGRMYVQNDMAFSCPEWKVVG